MPTFANQGLVQSLTLRAQRALLTEVAAQLKAPILFLKATWADPVLYGGQGERHGADVDVLVRPVDFPRFIASLSARGFTPVHPLTGERARYFEAKELSLLPPQGSAYLSIDLHRSLTDPCWFHCPPEPLFERAAVYDSPHGPIPSLSPEDQITYACLHYAVHIFDLDERHLRDIQRLITRPPTVAGCPARMDWALVQRRARETGTQATLALVLAGLTQLGVPPTPINLPLRHRLRARAIRRLIGRDGVISRGRNRSRALDYVAVRPLLSDDPLAGPRFWWTYGRPWLTESMKLRIGRPG